MYFIDVILPIPLEKTFTYSINKQEALFLKKGMRVAVSFGKSKIYTALVYKIHQEAPLVYQAKEISYVLDEHPIISEKQLSLWEWIASYYMCTLGEVYRASVPSAFLLESETLVMLNKQEDLEEIALNDSEWMVLEALQQQAVLKVQEIATIINKKNALPVVNKLLEKNIVHLKETLNELYKPKMVRYLKFNEKYTNDDDAVASLLDDLKRAPKQKEVVLRLFAVQATTNRPILRTTFEKQNNVSLSALKALIDKSIIDSYYLQTDRVQEYKGKQHALKELNADQANAFKEIRSNFKENKTVLLHGVTSSGKTEVYMKLIEEVIAKEQQVLYLLPEIALASQLVHRIQNYFGNKVSVYHSKYSANERVEVWNHVLRQNPKAQIVIGARSAVLLPFCNLGLVVVDESHEVSFKQFDPAPRYHARDVAVVLSTMHKANALLGTATPSIESYYNTTIGKYKLVEINRRHGNVLMPDIELIDLKENYRKKKMRGHFSERLLEEIQIALANEAQIILFQNRRGYAPVLECATCGNTPQCANCDVSLTYHNSQNKLRCHYCGYAITMPVTCLACDSTSLDTKGFGTEQIEAELKEIFPDVKVGRMDSDTTKRKYGYQKIINAFERQEMTILVGTQMLAKGLDFRNVNLVGIMNADSFLNFPDFRAHERSFQLIQQVAGRAGRTEKQGKVIIQTYNPYHQILQQASLNRYAEMFNDQINERKQFKYPPFRKNNTNYI